MSNLYKANLDIYTRYEVLWNKIISIINLTREEIIHTKWSNFRVPNFIYVQYNIYLIIPETCGSQNLLSRETALNTEFKLNLYFEKIFLCWKHRIFRELQQKLSHLTPYPYFSCFFLLPRRMLCKVPARIPLSFFPLTTSFFANLFAASPSLRKLFPYLSYTSLPHLRCLCILSIIWIKYGWSVFAISYIDKYCSFFQLLTLAHLHIW